MCGVLLSKYRSDYGGECPVAANDTALCSGYSYHLEFHVRVILKATSDRFAQKNVLIFNTFPFKGRGERFKERYRGGGRVQRQAAATRHEGEINATIFIFF